MTVRKVGIARSNPAHGGFAFRIIHLDMAGTAFNGLDMLFDLNHGGNHLSGFRPLLLNRIELRDGTTKPKPLAE
jgi:hypothetical protein